MKTSKEVKKLHKRSLYSNDPLKEWARCEADASHSHDDDDNMRREFVVTNQWLANKGLRK